MDFTVLRKFKRATLRTVVTAFGGLNLPNSANFFNACIALGTGSERHRHTLWLRCWPRRETKLKPPEERRDQVFSVEFTEAEKTIRND